MEVLTEVAVKKWRGAMSFEPFRIPIRRIPKGVQRCFKSLHPRDVEI